MTARAALMLILALPALALAGDVPRLIDDDGPARGARLLEMEERWRVGGEDGDLIFGRIVDVDMDEAGNVYVLDNQLCRVCVFSADGEHTGDLSREGEGPGEISQPTGLVLMPENVVGIAQGFPGEVVRLRGDGTPLPSLYPIGSAKDGNFGLMIGVDYADGVLCACGGRMVLTGLEDSRVDRFLSLTDDQGADPLRVLERTIPIDPTGRNYVEKDAYYLDSRWTLGDDGEIYAAMTRDAYEVSVYDRTGALKRVFGRDCSARERTEDEKSEITPLINVNGGPPLDSWEIEDHEPCISRILYDHETGHVWVLPSENDQPDGVLQTYDVFGPDGTYLERVGLPLGDEMNSGALYLFGAGRAVVVRGAGSSFGPGGDGVEDEELEPLEVICYAVK